MSEKTVTESEIEKDSTTTDEDRLEELEEQYQIEKLLNSPRDLRATITEVGWQDGTSPEVAGAICLLLSVPGATRYPVVVPMQQHNSADIAFVQLCESLGIRPENSLDELEGKSVDIDIERADGSEFAVLKAGESRVPGQLVEDFEIVTSAGEELPSTVQKSLSRLYQYRQRDTDETGTPVRVTELTAGEEQLIMHLEDGWGEIAVDTERAYEDVPRTPYEELVENVGQGSVKQIEDGQLWLVRSEELDGRARIDFSKLSYFGKKKHYDGYITSATDFTGDWSIFSQKPARSSDRLATIGIIVGIILFVFAPVVGNPLLLLMAAAVSAGAIYRWSKNTDTQAMVQS